MSNEKAHALVLAETLMSIGNERLPESESIFAATATELQTQHFRIKELEAMLESVGAGGVSAQRVTQGKDHTEQSRKMVAAPENLQSNSELATIVRELCAAYEHPLPEDALARSDAAIAKATGRADSADGEQKGTP